MTDLLKYLLATAFLLIFIGGIAFLTQYIPLLIRSYLP